EVGIRSRDVTGVQTCALPTSPLYGGAVLLIRELAVRCGLGWTGTLLLAAAFGLAMPGLVDLAMFGEDRSDVAYWADMREPTLIEPIGVSVSTTPSDRKSVG